MTDIQLPQDFDIDAYISGNYVHLMQGHKWRLNCTDYGFINIIKFRKSLLNKANRLGLSGHTVIINEKELFFQARRKGQR